MFLAHCYRSAHRVTSARQEQSQNSSILLFLISLGGKHLGEEINHSKSCGLARLVIRIGFICVQHLIALLLHHCASYRRPHPGEYKQSHAGAQSPSAQYVAVHMHGCGGFTDYERDFHSPEILRRCYNLCMYC